MATNCKMCDCPLLCLIGEARKTCVRCLSAKWKRARGNQKIKKPSKAAKTERICKDCKQLFPCPDGRRLRQCASCKKAHRKVKSARYRTAHRSEINRKNRQRYETDPTHRLQTAKQYYEAHREQVLARKRERSQSDRVSRTKLGMML